MAEEKSWDEIIKAAPSYLTKKFNKTVSKRFMKYVEDEEVEAENMDYITDDLEEDWESSNIIDEIGNECNLNDAKRKLLFEKLRILFGLDPDDGDVTMLDELDFTVTEKDMTTALEELSKQCPGLVSNDMKTDKAFLRAIAIGKKVKL